MNSVCRPRRPKTRSRWRQLNPVLTLLLLCLCCWTDGAERLDPPDSLHSQYFLLQRRVSTLKLDSLAVHLAAEIWFDHCCSNGIFPADKRSNYTTFSFHYFSQYNTELLSIIIQDLNWVLFHAQGFFFLSWKSHEGLLEFRRPTVASRYRTHSNEAAEEETVLPSGSRSLRLKPDLPSALFHSHPRTQLLLNTADSCLGRYHSHWWMTPSLVIYHSFIYHIL